LLPRGVFQAYTLPIYTNFIVWGKKEIERFARWNFALAVQQTSHTNKGERTEFAPLAV